VLAAAYADMGVVFNFTGATAANLIAYIMPPAFYIKLSEHTWKRKCAFSLIIFGIFSMFLGIASEIAILAT
jgi:amino acid permease